MQISLSVSDPTTEAIIKGAAKKPSSWKNETTEGWVRLPFRKESTKMINSGVNENDTVHHNIVWTVLYMSRHVMYSALHYYWHPW